MFTDIISGTQTLILGDDYPSGGKNVFTHHVGANFQKFGLDVVPEILTPLKLVQVHKKGGGGTFRQTFSSLLLSCDNEKLTISRSHIKVFSQTHPSCFGEYRPTFFLFKHGTDLFIISVFVSSGGLREDVDLFECARVWPPWTECSLVTPHLEI